MKAITVHPGLASSIRLEDRPEPAADSSTLLVQMLALGICGTDREIIAGHYGWPPSDSPRLVLGHESFGRVIDAPPASGFAAGDQVVGIVRHGDPVPCPACAVGEWDMCRNGRYVERGIKSLNGFGAERVRFEPEYTVKVSPRLGTLGVLLEPASVLAKAWDHIERIGRRTESWDPVSVLVTGAGPVGLLGALMAKQRGLVIHVLDRATAGPKPTLVEDLGARYYAGALPHDFVADITLECTGAPSVVADVLHRSDSGGIVCLVGVSSAAHSLPFDIGAFNRSTVLRNNVVFGSVNANRRHYEQGADALAKADAAWLSRLITRRVPLRRWQEAFERRPDDIKVVLSFEDAA